MPHYNDLEMPFGQFKGLPISEVQKYPQGRGYLGWLWRSFRTNERIRLYIALCDLFEVSNNPDDPEQVELAARMESNRKSRKERKAR